jgi:alanine racemase
MLASRQPSLISVRRDAWVEIDLAAFENNIAVVRSWLSPGCELMAVVKSDAYGHGAAQMGKVAAAAGADWLGVASVDEGCQLRAAGVSKPILILSPCPSWAMSTALESDLSVTVTMAAQVADLARAAERLGKRAHVQLKIDTGMHRLGVSPSDVMSVLSLIEAEKSLALTGLFSHLCSPDEEQATGGQLACFKEILSNLSASGKLPSLVHLASGEATRRFPDTHFNLARVGLYLYGLEPRVASQVVTPVMSVKARINHLQYVPAGECVGYGWTWCAERPTRLASIPIGYGDGVDRRLSNRMKGLLGGQQINQVGLISMDQMLFDVTDIPGACEGDVITLIGSDQSRTEGGGSQVTPLNLASWAAMLDTITYELACRMRVRLPRIYTRHKSAPAK